MFGLFGKKQSSAKWPPVPKWRPDIVQPLDRIIERMRYYADGGTDLALFDHRTRVMLEDGQQTMKQLHQQRKRCKKFTTSIRA